MAESISEGTLAKWHKSVGDFVARDEQLATVETDKVKKMYLISLFSIIYIR